MLTTFELEFNDIGMGLYPRVIKLLAYKTNQIAGIAQLGERQTEDLKVACSIHAHRQFGGLARNIIHTRVVAVGATLVYLKVIIDDLDQFLRRKKFYQKLGKS
ncbi:hypothetical protein MTR_5g075980 [Medicago truncatula]|uniref:Uncharacterized protein n=1 Tax=Medicago truncatula TaxID=3880 RepID=G7K5W2_MEDTR|nr:hypothetical protein MTR_5g075980 [Medicago truncatula]